jgi:spermidine synthase
MILVALALTVLTGFSGLVYEVTWQRYLAVLLGSHSEATAAVLAIFLGGLSVGYALFGAVTHRVVQGNPGAGRRRLLLLYGSVEAGIGLYALAFPWLFRGAQGVSLLVPLGSAGLGFGFDIVLAALLIGPPTVLMGGTIPILTQALSRDLTDATRLHAWVYAFNTAGAFAGAVAAGFVLIERLGLDGVLYAMGALNLVAGGTFLALQRLASGSATPARAASAAPSHFASYAVVALLAGFAMMAIQTVLNRIGGLAFGTSHFTFATIVGCFVLCIALGSFAVSALSRIPRTLIVGSQWVLVALLVLLYLVLPDATYWAHALRALFRDQDAGFLPFHLAVGLAWLAVLLLPVSLSGALLPLLFHHLRREVEDLGGVAGRLYSWNTVGSLLGALVGGYALLFWLDLHHVFRVALAALVLGASLLTVRVLRTSPGPVALLITVPVLVGLAALPEWSPQRLSAGLFRQRMPQALTFAGPEAFFAQPDESEILFYDDDPTSSVTVKEVPFGRGTTRAILTDGKPDGALVVDYVTMALAAVLPALFSEDPSRAFVIGWGTGVTAGELAALEECEEVLVAEISQGVLDAAPLFDHGNLEASRNPKIVPLRSDAYRALLRSPGEYGVIVSEPSNPWRVGVEMLYSREFLTAARDRLAPGGVYAQWLHLYEVDLETIEIVFATYASVFEQVSVWYTIGPDVLLLGFPSEPDLDPARLEARLGRPDFAAALKRLGLRSAAGLLAHELLPIGTLHAARVEAPLHALLRPILSHQAARAFFSGLPVDLPKLTRPASEAMGRQASLLRRYGLGEDGRLSETVLAEATLETCRRARALECATLLAYWEYNWPGSPLRARVLARARAEPNVSAHLAPDRLATLVALYEPGSQRPEGYRARLASARTATERYGRYYHHAAPFEREALRAAWDGCEAALGPDPPCRAGRRQAESALGPLGRRVAPAAR